MEKTLAISLILGFGIIIFLAFRNIGRANVWKKPSFSFKNAWRTFLIKNVSFYRSLSKSEKKHFEFKILEFLNNVKITPIDTTINDFDKILIAASAIIPIFSFPNWQYTNLNEVLIYPGLFNEEFNTNSNGRIAGMVGTGYMEGKMILSKNALRLGFKNESDKKNTAIHEFVHLIDKADGTIDGLPSILLEKQYALPWFDLIQKKIDEIYDGNSDINPYGATNKSEFFAVISEYFFERPKLLKQKHPKLYLLLEEIFNQEPALKEKVSESSDIHRNDPCPCGSGKKYKKCCGKIS